MNTNLPAYYTLSAEELRSRTQILRAYRKAHPKPKHVSTQPTPDVHARVTRPHMKKARV